MGELNDNKKVPIDSSFGNDILFNYYQADITKSTALGDVTLDRFLSTIKFPKKTTKEIFTEIREAHEAGDMKRKAELKFKLFSFTPCVYVKGRRMYENIQHWTGLMMLDFDKLPSVEYAKEWKEELFKEYKSIVAAWLSASQLGVRALVRIPVVHNVAEFKEYFHGIQLELEAYRGWDRAPQNCILPCFLSYDPDLLHRDNPKQWLGRYVPPPPAPIVEQYIITDRSARVDAIISSAINKIVDNGHPQLRAAAYVLGGYVGGGQIDIAEAIAMINSKIDGNAYLCQKASIYKKTAEQMIKKGRSQPLFVK